MPKVRCKECDEFFYAKAADIARGWGKFCSKSCKAKHQVKDRGDRRWYYPDDSGDDADEYGHPFASGFFGHGQS